MRWNEDQLAQYMARNGAPAAKRAPPPAPPPIIVEEPIFLDLPVPPSVNKTRRYDMAHSKLVRNWKDKAEPLVLAAKTSAINPLRLSRISRFEIAVIVSEDDTQMDLDNGLKTLIDYLKIIGVIRDDSKKHMRGLTVTWGSRSDAPEGCRVFVRPCT